MLADRPMAGQNPWMRVELRARFRTIFYLRVGTSEHGFGCLCTFHLARRCRAPWKSACCQWLVYGCFVACLPTTCFSSVALPRTPLSLVPESITWNMLLFMAAFDWPAAERLPCGYQLSSPFPIYSLSFLALHRCQPISGVTFCTHGALSAHRLACCAALSFLVGLDADQLPLIGLDLYNLARQPSMYV